MSSLFAVREFAIRKSNILNEFGIKEEFKSIRDGNTYSVSALFGLDSVLNMTKPAVVTKDGYTPVLKLVGTDELSESVIDDFLKLKKGLYSLASTTMLICYFKGKCTDGNWSSDSLCEIFLPCDMTESTVKGLRLNETSKVGCFPFKELPQLRERIFNELSDCYSSKSAFLLKRLS